ncbi:MAG: YkgJ family cysteine cluster protein [Desulfobacterales bacterium]
MELNSKLRVLEKIYKIYDEFSSGLNVACKKNCCLCCTENVTITTLEGFKVVEEILEKDKAELFSRIKESEERAGFQPRITINEMAHICMEGRELPEEEITPGGKCPLLNDNECSVYEYRPFGCRCFISTVNCAENGSAVVDDFVVTVNNIFMQVIEHVDSGRFSGNLSDVLRFLESAENRENLSSGKIRNPPSGLIKNHPLKILMIPPEHREKTGPIVDALKKLTY